MSRAQPDQYQVTLRLLAAVDDGRQQRRIESTQPGQQLGVEGIAAAAGANPGEKRKPYAVALYLTVAERTRLEAAVKAERRSVSGYVTRVIVAELARKVT